MTTLHRRPRGVALIDALVGLLVLTLGLLAVLRLQPLLRQQAETGRQRSEAVRLAQLELERQRSVALPSADDRTVDEPLSSTRYRVVREVEPGAWPNAVGLTVTVHWAAPDGAPQQLRLATLVARLDPALEGAAVLPR